ncbi:MAG: LruC domain-containing protein [Bacteroidota bacterium]
MKKQTYQSIFGLLLGYALILTMPACKKQDNSNNPGTTATSFNTMKINAGFKFENTQPVGIHIKTLDNQNGAVPNMKVYLYTDYPENGGKVIISGMTDNTGSFTSDYRIANIYDSVVVVTPAIGFANAQKVSVKGGSLEMTLGGKHEPQMMKSDDFGTLKTLNNNIYPMGTFNTDGVPTYLMANNDIIDNSMLQDINATMPEYIALPNSHPQYFNAGNETDLVLDQACDVWVTFVHEGAGYRNVLGYYKYNKNNPPASAAAIDSIHVIFPNVSFSGSGGGLTSGNKVHLGTFAPNTKIAWVLIADGFRGGAITNGNWILYSDQQFNPESSQTLKKHTILLNDIGREKFLLSFEDLRRDGSTDNDFNDAIFYVSANPIQAIHTTNIPLPNYTMTDTDGDGVSNNFDDYPNDPTKAFNNYYPTETPYGTLAFEDLWPGKGDYDFNDMILDYRYNQITNGLNKAVKINMTFILKAMGAAYKNGFGIQLPIAPSQVASVTGTSLHENFIVNNSNGTETGQTKATIIVFDNGYKLLPYPGGGGTGVNTTPGEPYVQPDTLHIEITLTTPIPLTVIGSPPYNPFLIINMERGKELHMVNYPPTDKADLSLFGTSSDDSDPASGRYYVTKENLPWIMDVPSPFSYPIEKTDITQTYNKLIPWAESSGNTYYDWFQAKPGYRNTQLLYTP